MSPAPPLLYFIIVLEQNLRVTGAAAKNSNLHLLTIETRVLHEPSHAPVSLPTCTPKNTLMCLRASNSFWGAFKVKYAATANRNSCVTVTLKMWA